MFALDTISFPNLGIVIENLPKSISVFGRFDIAFYGIIIGLGIAMGYIVASFQATRTGQDKEVYLDFAMYAVVVSIIGARIYYVVFSWDDYKDDIIQVFNLRAGGLAIYGGVIGGIITAIVYTKIKKMKFTLLADTACVGLLTGQIIGRWGNFFNREAFGDYTNNLFAMRLSTYDVNQNAITKKKKATMLASFRFIRHFYMSPYGICFFLYVYCFIPSIRSLTVSFFLCIWEDMAWAEPL